MKNSYCLRKTQAYTDIFSGCEFVVMGSDHRNPLNIIRSIGLNGFSVDLILIGSDRGMISKSKYIRNIYKVNTEIEAYEFLSEKYKHNDKVFVFTGDDKIAKILDMHRSEMNNNVTFNTNTPLNYFEKDEQYRSAEKQGLNVPYTRLWLKEEKYSIDECHFPIITVPPLTACHKPCI